MLHMHSDMTYPRSTHSSGLGIKDRETDTANHLMIAGGTLVTCASKDANENLGSCESTLSIGCRCIVLALHAFQGHTSDRGALITVPYFE